MFTKIINKTINKGYEAQNCELCKKDLSLFKLQRIHKCKRCLRFVCSDCGKQKAIIPGYDVNSNIPHRVCNICHRELDIQEKIIKRNDLEWNQNSFISEKWRNSINLFKLQNKKSIEDQLGYYDYLQQYQNNKETYALGVEFITKDIDIGKSDSSVFNYSGRLFIEKLQEGSTPEKCRENIRNVLIALTVKYPYLGYCQGMNYLAVILLCFTNEEVAFNLYCHLIENILPDNYFQKNGKGSGLIGLMAECYVMKNLIPNYFEDMTEVNRIQNFLEMQCPNYLLTLLINTLNIACVFHVWDQVFMENSVRFYFLYFILKKKGGYIDELIFENDLIFQQEPKFFREYLLKSIPTKLQQQIILPSIIFYNNIKYLFLIKQIMPFEKCIISIIQINKESIINYAKNPNINEIILRNTQYDELKAKMNFQIPEEQRQQLMKQFYQELNEKWTKSNTNIHLLLKKITKFSIDEIKYIQKEFNNLIEQSQTQQINNEQSQNKVQIENEEQQNNYNTQNECQSNDSQKKGITKVEFLNLMMKLNLQYNVEKKIMIKNEQKISKIFELFMEVEGGVLQFREFLCCMGIVARGDVKEKLEMFFYIFDANKKEYLQKCDFLLLIDTLVYSIGVIERNLELKQDAVNFLDSLEEEYKDKEKISLSEFLFLLSSPFIQDLTYLQQIEQSKSICEIMTLNLRTLSS